MPPFVTYTPRLTLVKRLAALLNIRRSTTFPDRLVSKRFTLASSDAAVPANEYSRRLTYVIVPVLLFALCLALRLGYLQIVRHAYYLNLATGQQTDPKTLKPDRGRILDRNLNIMALTVGVESFGVRKFFTLPIPDAKKHSFIASLAEYTGQDPSVVTERLRRSTNFTYLARLVEKDAADKIKDLPDYPLFEKFIQIDLETKRQYPFGEVGGQIVGFSTDGVGKAGLELSFNAQLKGEKGRVLNLVDGGRKRKVYDRISNSYQPAVAGQDIALTIDAACQSIAEKTLHETVVENNAMGGMIIVMQPVTGEILAMASQPTFDPNDPQGYDLSAQKMKPLVDTYEPGSTFKLVAATSALDTRTLTADAMIGTNGGKFSVGSHTITDHEKFGTLTLRQVIEHSSNVGTIKIAQASGGAVFFDYVRRFGFGMKTGVDLPGEAKGFLLNPTRWSNATLPTMAIGYGISVTGLQLITAYSAIANGGLLMEPRIIRGVAQDDGTIELTPPTVVRRVMSPETAATMRDILTGVVDEGTGKNAAIQGYLVAGKTGTAWKARTDGPGYTKNYRSSFIGMFPADNPQMVALVMIDEPRNGKFYGGAVAAPAFKKVVETIMQLPDGPIRDLPAPKTEDGVPLYLAKLHEIIGNSLLYADRDSLAEADSVETNVESPIPLEDLELLGSAPLVPVGPVTPSVIGMSMREALSKLAKQGIRASSVGTGRVIRQIPPAGNPVIPGSVCLLECQPIDVMPDLPQPKIR